MLYHVLLFGQSYTGQICTGHCFWKSLPNLTGITRMHCISLLTLSTPTLTRTGRLSMRWNSEERILINLVVSSGVSDRPGESEICCLIVGTPRCCHLRLYRPTDLKLVSMKHVYISTSSDAIARPKCFSISALLTSLLLEQWNSSETKRRKWSFFWWFTIMLIFSTKMQIAVAFLGKNCQIFINSKGFGRAIRISWSVFQFRLFLWPKKIFFGDAGRFFSNFFSLKRT